MRKSTFIWIASLGLACTESPTPKEAAEPPKAAAASKPAAAEAPKAEAEPTSEEGGTVALHAHMHEHFVRLDRLQKAVVRGDLEGARGEARWLAEHEAHADLPKGWEPHIQAMRKAAQDMLSSSAGEAAHAAARVADSCGGCHAANEARVNLGYPPFPTTEPKKVQEQVQWVADRFWDAVVSGSDELWSQGIEGLQTVSAALKEPKEAQAPGAAAPAWKSVLEGARGAEDRESRVKVLGDQLQACAALRPE